VDARNRYCARYREWEAESRFAPEIRSSSAQKMALIRPIIDRELFPHLNLPYEYLMYAYLLHLTVTPMYLSAKVHGKHTYLLWPTKFSPPSLGVSVWRVRCVPGCQSQGNPQILSYNRLPFHWRLNLFFAHLSFVEVSLAGAATSFAGWTDGQTEIDCSSQDHTSLMFLSPFPPQVPLSELTVTLPGC